MTPLPKHTMHVRTELWFRPQEKSCPTECLSVHQQRQLKSQVKALSKTAFHQGNRLLVAEVFSPPRFAPAAKELGFAAFSFDLQNGYDFRKKEDRNYVAQLLRDKPPELLVLSPPCTHEGGWHNLCTSGSVVSYFNNRWNWGNVPFSNIHLVPEHGHTLRCKPCCASIFGASVICACMDCDFLSIKISFAKALACWCHMPICRVLVGVAQGSHIRITPVMM